MLIIKNDKAKIIPECEKCFQPMIPQDIENLNEWYCVNCKKKFVETK